MVVDEPLTPLLGRKAAEHMQLITVNYDNLAQIHATHEFAESTVLTDYPAVFDGGLGTLPGVVHLHIDDTIQPVSSRPRRIPITLEKEVSRELDNLVKQGVICPVNEPSEWGSQMAVTTRKSGAIRICIDPRPLNVALKRSHYQLPTIDEVLPKLVNARIISKLDLEQAFWHCKLDEESSKLTTFATHKGRFRWLRLPFGTSVSSEEFQKRLNQALDDIDGIVCVADDILVYGVGDTTKDAMEDHQKKLTLLLQRCTKLGIKLNKAKSILCCTEVPFLGHLITSEGLKPDPGKIDAILKMQQPTTVQEVQRLNGTVNYLAHFLPRLSSVMQPLMKLTRKEQPWI